MQKNDLYSRTYNPDVLSTLANLSSDEVFTPPDIVNSMLDLLPVELWRDKNSTFLDPACKSGVFLREIAKRLIKGLEEQIPELQERLDHIFHNQLFGIAITELTSLLTRRSLYGSKYPNSMFSFSRFENHTGNIMFNKVNHTWLGERCLYCGGTKEEFDRGSELETHAYDFIHKKEPKEIFNMKFDVIIGNPPYQLDDGGAGASAKPIYHLFVEQAKKMNPRYITMIIPSRWFSGGKGLDRFRQEMINDLRIKEIHDFLDASDCFSGVEIKGGVNYFLWDRDFNGDAKIHTYIDKAVTSVATRKLRFRDEDIFVRYNEAISIIEKVSDMGEVSISNQISSRKPFGLSTNFKNYTREKMGSNNIKLYALNQTGYVSIDDISRNREWVDSWKVLVPYAVGIGDMSQDRVRPFIAEPESCCTETYLVAMTTSNRNMAENLISYYNTKFFHFLLGVKKISQHTTASVYSFIPVQDFSKTWTDEELYNKYNLSENEISFIETMIKSFD